MTNIYVVSALVTKPGMHGHRAVVTTRETREEAIAYAMEEIVVDGWAVVSYDCGLCESVMKVVERNFVVAQISFVKEYGLDALPDSEYRLACDDIVEALEDRLEKLE